MKKPENNNKINKKLMWEMKYGLSGNDPHTLRAIGKKFNISREGVRQILKNEGFPGERRVGNQIIFSCPRLVKQPWFPIKSQITLRKLIDTEKIKAVDLSSNPKLKRYYIGKQEAIAFLNARDDLESESASPKNIKRDKNYFSCPALIKQPWFPVKSLVTLNKLIKQGKIKAVNLSTSPKFKRYYIHKDEAIKYVADVLRRII